MAELILVLNAGSSSIKFSAYVDQEPEPRLWLSGQIEGLYTAPAFSSQNSAGERLGSHAWEKGTRLGHDGAIAYLTDFLRGQRGDNTLLAVGHRVVHGGPQYSQPVLVDAGVVEELEKHVPLAPLHQPHNLAPIRILLGRRPPVPQVACFDTAFHHTQP